MSLEISLGKGVFVNVLNNFRNLATIKENTVHIRVEITDKI